MITNWHSELIENWLEPIGWTIIHSSWQIGIIGIAYMLGRRLLTQLPQQEGSRLNYNWACLCLFAMAISPMVTLWFVAQPPQQTAMITSNSISLPPIDLQATTEFSSKTWQVDVATEAAEPSFKAIPTDIAEPSGWPQTKDSPSFHFWIVAIWLTGVLVTSLRPLMGLWNVQRLKRKGLEALPQPIQNQIAALSSRVAEQVGFDFGTTSFLQSSLVRVPTVIGFLRPLVLLPPCTLSGLTPCQLEMIIAHELAHICRRDYFINVIQTMIETVLFYHPFVWILSAEIRAERENCCDDIAIASSGNSAEEFARTLLQLEQQAQAIFPPALAGNGGSLVKRVRRLLNAQPANHTATSFLATFVSTSLLLAAFTSALVYANQDSDGPVDPVTGNQNEISKSEYEHSVESALHEFDRQANQIVVAKVNGVPIYRERIESKMLRESGSDALESLINQRILFNHANKHSISVEPNEIEAKIARQADKVGLSKERYENLICGKRKFSLAFLHQTVASQLLLEKLLQAQGLTDESKFPTEAARLFERLTESAEVDQQIHHLHTAKGQDIVARVDGHPITIQEVIAACFERSGQKALESEINREIISQALKSKNQNVTKDDIKSEILRIARNMGIKTEDGTLDQSRWLKQIGIGDDKAKREHYENEQVWPTVALRKLVSHQALVDDEDIVKALESRFDPRAKVLAIVLQDQKTATKVWHLAKSDPTKENFQHLAHIYSVDPTSKANYGQVPPIRKHSNLDPHAFSLKPGDISPLIQFGKQWVILYGQGKVDDDSWRYSFLAVSKELQALKERQIQEAISKKFEELKASAKIEVVDHDDWGQTSSNHRGITVNNIAEQDGVVTSMHVKNGDIVTAGDVLVTLRNESLELAIEELEQEIALADPTVKKIYEVQLDVFQEKQARLKCLAPLNGVVAETLVEPGQPVQAGQVLVRLRALKPQSTRPKKSEGVRNLQSQVFRGRAKIDRLVKQEPRQAREQLDQLILMVNSQELDQAYRQRILEMLKRDRLQINEMIRNKTDGVRLKYRSKNGDKIRWITSQKTTTNMRLDGRNEKNESLSNCNLLWSVTDHDENSLTLSQTIETVNITRKVNGKVESAYQSSSDQPVPDEYSSIAKRIGETDRQVSVNRQGKLVAASWDIQPEELQKLLPILPDKPLQVGDRWETPLSFTAKIDGESTTFTSKARYQLNSIRGNLAKISVATDPIDDPRFRKRFPEKRLNGTIDFDILIGLPIKTSYRWSETFELPKNGNLQYDSTYTTKLDLNAKK